MLVGKHEWPAGKDLERKRKAKALAASVDGLRGVVELADRHGHWDAPETVLAPDVKGQNLHRLAPGLAVNLPTLMAGVETGRNRQVRTLATFGATRLRRPTRPHGTWSGKQHVP